MSDAERVKDPVPPVLRSRVDALRGQEATVQSALENDDFDTVRDTILAMELVSLEDVWEVIKDGLVEGKMAEVKANRFIDTLLDAKPSYFSGDKDVDLDHGRVVGHVVGLLGRLDIIDRLITPERGDTTDGAYTAAGIVQGLGHQSNEAGFAHTRSRIVHFPEEFRQAIEAQFVNGLPAKV